jgi:hypothetical protein
MSSTTTIWGSFESHPHCWPPKPTSFFLATAPGQLRLRLQQQHAHTNVAKENYVYLKSDGKKEMVRAQKVAF